MELFETLKSEHGKVEQVLQKLMDTSERSGKSRQSGLERLRSLLIPHMQGEEQAFYPALMESEAAELGYQAMEEHRAARAVLEDLQELDVTDKRWHARCQVLQELISHHIEEEESEIFSRAREIFDQDRIKELGRQYSQREQQAKKRAA